jgi:hypothetical protein
MGRYKFTLLVYLIRMDQDKVWQTSYIIKYESAVFSPLSSVQAYTHST